MPRLPYISLRLAAHWRRTVRHAWSMRLFGLAALFSICEVVLQLSGSPFPPIVTAVLITLLSVGGLVARLTAQKQFEQSDD